jgi:hypothetical protein
MNRIPLYIPQEELPEEKPEEIKNITNMVIEIRTYKGFECWVLIDQQPFGIIWKSKFNKKWILSTLNETIRSRNLGSLIRRGHACFVKRNSIQVQ